MITFLYGSGLLFSLILGCFLINWSRYLNGGATAKESALELPGDGIVAKIDFNATRCITINAPPDRIWRWIIQMGSKRAGWYSVDWIDHHGTERSKRILPLFQKIKIGQFIPFTPDQKNGMWVQAFQENSYIIWTDKVGNASWLWYLIPDADGNTRLLTRLRTRYNWKNFWIIYCLIYDVGDIMMMSLCMKGIKNRAEDETPKLKTNGG